MSKLALAAPRRRSEDRRISDVGLVLIICIAMVFVPIAAIALAATTGALGEPDAPPAATASR